nr:hypothetical protein Itr_chr04CG19900 [Ipomoea trifida]
MAILRTDVTMVPTGEGSSGGKPSTSFLFTEVVPEQVTGVPVQHGDGSSDHMHFPISGLTASIDRRPELVTRLNAFEVELISRADKYLSTPISACCFRP